MEKDGKITKKRILEDQDNEPITTTTTADTANVQVKVEETEAQPQEDVANIYKIPCSHEAVMKEHVKILSTFAIDAPGVRIISGSYDCDIRFWDFAGMDSSMKSFRLVEPWEEQASQIKSLAWSPTGDKFTVAAVCPIIKVYDRDGFPKGETIQGDMYISDLANTKGHVSNVVNCMWDPSLKNLFLSGSVDGTCRVWDVDRIAKQSKQVIKTKSSKSFGRRNPVTYCSYSFQGNQIAAGCQDGSVQIWGKTGPFTKPAIYIPQAHFEGSDISCLAFHSDCSTLVTRALDDTMKVWDLRKPTEPLIVFNDLPSHNQTTVCFSPSGDLILTGTAPPPKFKGTGLLTFFDKRELKLVKSIGIEPEHGVLGVAWHPKINQIIAGTTSGRMHLLYDPVLSVRGALLCVNRKPRVKDPNDFEAPRIVQTPNALPMYADEEKTRRETRERFNPKKNAKTDITFMTGPGRGGKIGSSLTQFLMQNYIKKDEMRDQDPRDAILKYAEEADKNPLFFGAYKKTQPKPIFDLSEEKEEQDK